MENLAEQYGLHIEYIRAIAEHRAHTRTPIREKHRHTANRSQNKQKTTRNKSNRKVRERLGNNQEWRCAYCQHDITHHSSLDHITPLARGGPDSPENLHLTCRECNRRKKEHSDTQYRQLLNRRQKAEALTTISPTQYNSRFNVCTCHIHGCYPECQGCELCDHRPWEAPERIACPASEAPPAPCRNREQCATARACSQMPPRKPKNRPSRPWTLDQHRSFFPSPQSSRRRQTTIPEQTRISHELQA